MVAYMILNVSFNPSSQHKKYKYFWYLKSVTKKINSRESEQSQVTFILLNNK